MDTAGGDRIAFGGTSVTTDTIVVTGGRLGRQTFLIFSVPPCLCCVVLGSTPLHDRFEGCAFVAPPPSVSARNIRSPV